MLRCPFEVLFVILDIRFKYLSLYEHSALMKPAWHLGIVRCLFSGKRLQQPLRPDLMQWTEADGRYAANVPRFPGSP